MELERRYIKGGKLTRRSKDDKSGITGYASVFNEAFDDGYYVETIIPGAFSRALKEQQDVRCLFNHDANNVLGRTKSGTLRLAEDGTGLNFDCDTDPNTHIASDVASMIDRGDVDGCSFAFVVRKQTWRDVTDDQGHTRYYRDIEDVDLFDVGPVTYPAYAGTSVDSRSRWPEGVPSEVRSHVPALAKREARSNVNDCECDCPECMADDCEHCSNSTCVDTNCLSNRSHKLSEAEVRGLLARIDVAAAA